jgi:hypothetical protein
MVSHVKKSVHWERTRFTGCGSMNRNSMLTEMAPTKAAKFGKVLSAC